MLLQYEKNCKCRFGLIGTWLLKTNNFRGIEKVGIEKVGIEKVGIEKVGVEKVGVYSTH